MSLPSDWGLQTGVPWWGADLGPAVTSPVTRIEDENGHGYQKVQVHAGFSEDSVKTPELLPYWYLYNHPYSSYQVQFWGQYHKEMVSMKVSHKMEFAILSLLSDFEKTLNTLSCEASAAALYVPFLTTFLQDATRFGTACWVSVVSVCQLPLS